jgi:Calcineurin-like phosphoesterase
MSFNLTIGTRVVTWDQATVQNKLAGLAHLDNKRSGWIQGELNIGSSGPVSRFFWSIVGKRFETLRERFFGVNLAKSQNLLTQLQPQIHGTKNNELIELFRGAVEKYNEIAPHYSVAIAAPPVPPRESAVKPAPRRANGPEPRQQKHSPEVPSRTGRKQLNDAKSSPIGSIGKPVARLIKEYDETWNPATRQFDSPLYNEENFVNLLKLVHSKTQAKFDPQTAFGFIQKKDLPPNSTIVVRADLHGDLKSLTENLKTMQQQGLLDQNFRCKPNVHLVFLGDYVDRGSHTMQVLELLVKLRLENPKQVTLIRGNHEDLFMGMTYGNGDQNYKNFAGQKANTDLLDALYNTMPLTLFMSEQKEGERQYAVFTHAAFEFHVDPSELLENPAADTKMVVSKERKLSERVSRLQADERSEQDFGADKAEGKQYKQIVAAKRINELFEADLARHQHEDRFVQYLTAYNWGDIGRESSFGTLMSRKWKISPEDFKHYLRLCSPKHPVKFVFRGHEHRQQHHRLPNGKLLISTMPIGMDGNPVYMAEYGSQNDTCYILKTAPKVKDWTKTAVKRPRGQSTAVTTDPVNIRDASI